METISSLVRKPKVLAVTALLCLVILLVHPLTRSMEAALCLCLAALILWGASAVDTTVVSAGFLAGGLLLGLAPPSLLFRFPFTQNFWLIILSYLITEGVTRTGIARLFARRVMARLASTPLRLVLFSYVAGVLLIFFIPQPFPRVILLAAFYREFFKEQKLPASTTEVLYFSIFTASTFTSMFFLSGDTLLNYVVVAISGASITWGEWALAMSVPVTAICVVTYLLFWLVFRRELRPAFSSRPRQGDNAPLTRPQRQMIGVSALIFLAFATQGLHQLPAAAILLGGVLALWGLGILDPKAIRAVNWRLLVFFTAAFAVGDVFNYSGLADRLVGLLTPLLPEGSFTLRICFLILLTLILNFLLGSAVTTSSVVIPTLGRLGVLPAGSPVLTLFVYTVVSVQYILPFHHATVLVGYGEGLYGGRIIARYGIPLTIFTFFAVLWFCLPWWQVVGLL